MKIKKSIATLAGAVCAAALLISVPAQAQKAKLVINNQSSLNIHQFYLTTVYADNWGPEWLQGDVIYSDESHSMLGIRCDTYNVKLVDQDGDVCVIRNVDLCGGREDWTLTDDYLLKCEDRTQG